MEINYYEMTYDDIPQISAMESKYFSQPWAEASIAHYMETGHGVFFVARDNNACVPRGADDGTAKVLGTKKVAGYCAITCVLDEAELVSIAVDEKYRNMGLARELLDIAYDFLKKNDVSKLHLEVRESNAAARALYESEGFVPVGRRRGFYSKPAEDALLFTKEL